MNKKGFTLVELLAVILVITIITLIALPQVLNQFSNYTGELEEKEKELILEAGRAYVEMNSSSFTTSKCITINTLVDAELLSLEFLNEALGSGYNDIYKIKVTNSHAGYVLTLVDAGSC